MVEGLISSAAIGGKGSQAGAATGATGLMASDVIAAVAVTEGVDLQWLGLPSGRRPTLQGGPQGEGPPRLLDWDGDPSPTFEGPGSARRFFEEFELHPGLVVRSWGHPGGRLGFGLHGEDVVLELHLPDAGLLVRAAPGQVKVALRDTLPETVCVALVGKPLERLVAWPPMRGPGYLISSVEAEEGVQVVTVPTAPIRVAPR